MSAMSSSAPVSVTAAAFLDDWDARLSAWAKDGETPVPRVYDRSDAPRPLMLHLAMAGACHARATLEAAGLAPDLVESLVGGGDIWSAAPDPARGLEVGVESLARLAAMLAGIDAYRRHPWKRPPDAAPCVWRRGSARLLDYGADGGRPALVVPSLVNRAHVLDIMPGHSMVELLGREGLRPLLLDWGEPGAAEADFGIEDYVLGVLVEAAQEAAADGPAPVIGYCMGGNLALALAALRPDLIERLALVATPWDFAASRGAAGCLRAVAREAGEERMEEMVDGLDAAAGGVPVDFLQAIFAMLDPNLAARKYAGFAAMEQDGEAARRFVAVEDWINDGVPLVRRAASDVLVDWCLRNVPMEGAWRVAGEAIRPESARCPALVAASTSDRIAPLESVAPLAERLPDGRRLDIDAGHVGMMVGSRAPELLWRPLAAWCGGDA